MNKIIAFDVTYNIPTRLHVTKCFCNNNMYFLFLKIKIGNKCHLNLYSGIEKMTTHFYKLLLCETLNLITVFSCKTL